MLPATAVPFTGPYYGPSSVHGPMKGLTAKALKRALVRLKYFAGDLTKLDDHYNRGLETSMRKWQKSLADVQPSGQYGLGSWYHMRAAKVLDGPHKGEYAMDGVCQQLIQKEWKADQLPTAVEVREAITNFCMRAEAAQSGWHYDQRRPFTGITNGKADAPEVRHTNDCSGYVVLAYAWARDVTKLPVQDPARKSFSSYGNTWDDEDGHQKVSGSYLVGDLAHYDGHVTICRHAGDSSRAIWSSMGSELGPRTESLFYRDDFMFVVRPPLP